MSEATAAEQALVPVRAQNPSLRPANLAECKNVGEILAASRFFNDSTKAAQAMTKVIAGRELGLAAFASMTGIYFVKGRLTLSANAMGTLIQKFLYPGTDIHRFRYRVGKHTRNECEITFFEFDRQSNKWEEVGTSAFTMDDAKVAGLGSGDNWRKYPRNMLFARAMSNGAKWYTPAVFGGQTPYLPDELDQQVKATEEGEYVVDGKIVQSVPEVVDAEVITEDTQPTPAVHFERVACEPGSALETLQNLIEETKTDVARVCSHYEVSSLAELDQEAIENCTKNLLSKKAALTK